MMTFEHFQIKNRKRAELWHQGREWKSNDWATATAGELGEACNISKKLKRDEDGLVGSKKSREELLKDLESELADTVTYLFLWADAMGVELGRACAETFNKVSDRNGFDIKIESYYNS